MDECILHIIHDSILLGIKNKKKKNKTHKIGMNMSKPKTLVFQQSHKRRVFILRHGNDNKTTETFKHL